MVVQNTNNRFTSISHYGLVHNEVLDIPFSRPSALITFPIDILQLVWNNLSDGMLLTDSDGLIIAANSSFCSLINKREKELIGKEFTVIFSDQNNADILLKQYMQSLKEGTFQRKSEKLLHLHDGTSVEIEVIKTELLDDAQERYLLSEYRDISDRKRWERNVQASELNYRSLFNNAVFPMYQSTIDGRIVNANNSMVKLLGYDSLIELRNITIESELYFDCHQSEAVVEIIKKDGIILDKELQLKKKDGSIIHVLLYSRAITDDSGTITGFEGTIKDITFSKEAEEKISSYVASLELMQNKLLTLNTQRDEIIATISHDLRSPLSSIFGFCDLLNDEFTTLSDKEKIEFIGYIKKSAQQQLSIINSMMDLPNIEMDKTL